jgi:excinuclease ABC subunit C
MKKSKHMHISERIMSIVSGLPHNPGVYQYFNDEGKIIYIGKAKDLRKRVSSYFNRDSYDNAKLNVLVRKIFDIKYIVVENESDALLLENNLIKKYQPRYNILLKDDKTFPWIAIKNELFPRVISTRNYINDGSEYFGPYTSGLMVKTLLSLIKKLYPLRTCSLDLSPEKNKSGKYKPCLEYHVGNCKAPCIDKQTLEEYDSNIKTIKEIIKGNISDIENYLKELMKQYSLSLDFENANVVKEKIEILRNYKSKSTIVNPNINNIDVFSIVEKKDDVAVNFLRVINGAIVQVHSVDTKRKLDETLGEILSLAITDIRQKMLSSSNEIVVSEMPDTKIDGIKYTLPKQGDKLKLLELSKRNALLFLSEKLKLSAEKTEQFKERKDSILERMMKDLELKKLPYHIECFDNSNLQGTNPVASCVVFKNAKPAKSEYRHFNVKTVVGPDDFASMREIVYRRYKRLLEENLPLPDLVVVDGGKGQLHAAIDIFYELELTDKVQLIGIAKKLEEIFKPGDSVPLYLDKNSPSLKIIQHIRNEAHRFGITFHRNKRSIEFTNSALDDIKNIGEITKDQLFTHFKSFDNIKNASLEDLIKIIGKSKAQKVINYFNDNSLVQNQMEKY